MKTKFSSINLLQELKKPENIKLRQEFTEQSYMKDRLIYSPAHDQDFVFIVKRGKVRIYLATEDKEFSLAILGPGDIYSSHTRAHVLAMEDAALLLIPTNKFHHFMVIYPHLSRTIISVLGDLLKQSFSIIESLVFKDISHRLTDFLLYEATHNGSCGKEGTIIDLNLTTEQLGAIIGSSRQTVSTIISGMLRAEVIRKQSRSVFIIPNLELLKDYPQV